MFANTGSASCPLAGVPIELLRSNGQVMQTTSAADGTFSFSISLGEPVQVKIPPYNGFAWSSSYSPIAGASSRRRLAASANHKAASRSSNTNTAGNSSNSPSPTLMPTTTSSPTLMHYAQAKMIHRFTFDNTAAANQAQIPDVQSNNDYAAIHNGVTLSGGQAVFSKSANPKAQPYLSLSPGWFGNADAVSVEMWLSVDSATQDNAALFSFGDPSSPEAYFSLTAKGFQGVTNTYLAAVLNPPLGVLQVYVNGSLSVAQAVSRTPLFDGQGSSEKFNCIGWDLQATTPGFIGSIDEIRFWDGALSADNITETAVLGVDPTIINLSSSDTIYNVLIDYLVTSEIVANVGFYGGLSLNKMFGSESVFLIEALDPQCTFNTTVALDPYYSASSVLLPAMNYSVTLLPYAKLLPAPTVSGYLCSPSLDPHGYLAAANQLSTQIYTDLLLSFSVYATFIYHTGLCMSIKGSEEFATSEPAPDNEGRACYSNSATMLQRGQAWPLNITLFELYPSYTGKNPAWTSSPVAFGASSGLFVQDFVVLDSTVEIADVVSGYPAPKTFIYSDMLYSNATMKPPSTPADLNYTITAAMPLPSAPYALPFTVLATRNSPEGAATVLYKAFIPILGTIPSEVPNFYPVTTDPTLIFMVLRDPPGGGSQATIAAGSSFTTSMTIEGMKTFEQDIHATVTLGAEVEEQSMLILAPLGFGIGVMSASGGTSVTGKGDFVAPDVTVTRTSTTQYTYAFSFAYDFSTSSNPFIAGHPSDVIIGGGMDVIVSEALEGEECMNIVELHYFFH